MLDLKAEQKVLNSGFCRIAGVDEAGRGPLAGPVVAACVIWKNDIKKDDPRLELVKDSKKLTEKKREQAFGLISGLFTGIGVGVCDRETIDRINILEASFLAMKKAISALKERPDYILLDGNLRIPNLSIFQEPVVNGDATIFSIAAASIIAKVTRDRLMRDWHEKYPVYGFDKHKGYGTKLHLARLQEYGVCPIHRRSFRPISIIVQRTKLG